MQLARTLLAIILAGFAFFYFETFLVGYSAAISYPTWYAEFVAKHSRLGFALWDLFTVVPIVLLSAILVGAVLGRLIDRNFFIAGLSAVIVAVVYAIVLSAPDLGVTAAIRNHLLPVFWFNLPSYLAIWLALPLATMYFGNKTAGPQNNNAEAPS